PAPPSVRSYGPPAVSHAAPRPYVSSGEWPDRDETNQPTSVHTYTMEEISGLGDLGDLAVPGASESSVPPPPSSEDGDAYLAVIGGLDVVPRLVLPHGRVTDLPLGVQAAFVLSRIDGLSSVEDILDISGLSRLTTLRILHELVQKGLLRV